MKKNKDKKKDFSRYYLFYLAISIIFLLIIVRLLYLQIVMVEEYRELSNNNSYKTVSVNAARGDIVDANGNVFATSIQSYVLEYNESDENKKEFYNTISEVLKIIDEKNIKQIDEFPIVIENGEYVFKFQATKEEDRLWLESRFKKDRGFDELVARKLYGEGTKLSSLNEKQKAEVDEALLKISAEEVYKVLEERYKLSKSEYKELKDEEKVKYDLEQEEFNSLSLEEKRRYLIIQDGIFINQISGDNPVVIANNIDEETAFVFEQQLTNLPGIVVNTQPMRYYPEKELGSSFLGYISSINPWEQQKYEELGYDVSADEIGASGIESAFESYLKGSKGQQRIQVNKYGRTIRVLGEVEAYAGDTVQLNIDMNIQKVAERALEDTLKELQKLGASSHDADTTNATRGAVVAIRNTGEILALASYPGYDPNMFTTPGLLTPDMYKKYFNPDLEEMGKAYIRARNLANKSGILTDNELATLSKEERESILLDRMFPIDNTIEGNTTIRQDLYDIFPKSFYNYATLSTVPPGSTFKPVSALAGLEEGVIDGGTIINDKGTYTKNNYTGKCWITNMYGGSHGPINVTKALEVSCNYFFYEVADRLYSKTNTVESLDLLAKYAWQLGLGVPYGSGAKASTGIEINENFGQVYNYESSKSSLANSHVNRLVTYLERGIKSTNAVPHYKPFDIVQGEEKGEGKELEQIKTTNEKKKVLVDKIKAEMKANKDEQTPDNDLFPQLITLVENVIKSNPALEEIGYTDKDIDGISNAILQAIIDGRSEISSPGNAYSAAIGQGQNTFTPIQLASYVATLLNGGTRYELKLVDKIIDSDTGEVVEDITPQVISQANFDPRNIEIVKQGMKEVTNGESGTSAAIFQGFPISNGGKTGTSNIIDETRDDAVGRDAAGVYIGFAPYDNPEIIVCSIVFDGGHGKGNITKAIFEEYFRDRILEQNKNYKFMYNIHDDEAKKEEDNK
ncbi:MAG: penicillin-binding transpeptidase domain-containing protein [Clostridium sp.]|nr:penicillin-binding transpeptidase domain-containing protein [Clostridium sp.]